MRTDKDN